MESKDWLKLAEQKLDDSGISSARLDALILLEDSLNKDRSWVLANPSFKLNPKIVSELYKKLIRRTSHEPLAYIRQKSHFFGNEFMVTADTLEPRPETETMVEIILNQIKKPPLIVDVGTGSGAIAISLKLKLPSTRVIGIDISSPCIKVAKANAKKLSADVEFLVGNLLEPVQGLDLGSAIITANLPYVPDSMTINKSAMFEPSIAIFGGTDGLDYYRHFLKQIDQLKNKPSYVLTESLPPQHQSLKSIASNHGYSLNNSEDFIQVFTAEVMLLA